MTAKEITPNMGLLSRPGRGHPDWMFEVKAYAQHLQTLRDRRSWYAAIMVWPAGYHGTSGSRTPVEWGALTSGVVATFSKPTIGRQSSSTTSTRTTAAKNTRIKDVKLYQEQNADEKAITHHGKAFIDSDKGKIFILEFIRPKAFRLRFNPEYQSLLNYVDSNSRNLVQHSLKDLIDTLDQLEAIHWEVVCEEEKDYVKIESLRKKNFKIVVVQPVQPQVTSETADISKELMCPRWTNATQMRGYLADQAEGISYCGKTTVVEVEKPGWHGILVRRAGGRQLLKTKVIVDYFNYDMHDSQVHGVGPLDSREPLYHSEPFWMEVAQHPGHLLKVASFVDNFSQVCLDIGSRDNSEMRVVTRFNSMQLCVLSSDSISGLITCIRRLLDDLGLNLATFLDTTRLLWL
ncbi:hypothetical protein RhiJN_12046 [Ceratobasidium sp. AG-Ba]|nr:hypothetical protein RhiJN_12046 [Ceratobasidium sp. AG-Ba]